MAQYEFQCEVSFENQDDVESWILTSHAEDPGPWWRFPLRVVRGLEQEVHLPPCKHHQLSRPGWVQKLFYSDVSSSKVALNPRHKYVLQSSVIKAVSLVLIINIFKQEAIQFIIVILGHTIWAEMVTSIWAEVHWLTVVTCVIHHLVNIVLCNVVIEHGVEVIEQLNNLHWRTLWAQKSESNNIGEVDGHTIIQLSSHSLSLLQFFSDLPVFWNTSKPPHITITHNGTVGLGRWGPLTRVASERAANPSSFSLRWAQMFFDQQFLPGWTHTSPVWRSSNP